MQPERLKSLFRGLPVPLFVGVSFLLAVGFLLVRVPEADKAPSPGNSAGGVSVVRLDSKNADLVLRQEASLRDPAPLFLPTAWNTAHAIHDDRILVRPGDSFEDYGAKYVYEGSQNPVQLPGAVRMPDSPARAFDPLLSDKPFVGLAPRQEALKPLPPRAACLEVRESGTGTQVVQLIINDLELNGGSPWPPAEFLACVNEVGLLGRPALVSGTGMESVDRDLEKALLLHWPELEKLGRLEPGFYRVSLGP